VLRRVRDELFDTTSAGRDWIALFERVQTPLLTVVLEDERLSGTAAELLSQAGSLFADDEATVDRHVVNEALALLRELEERAPSREARTDLRVMRAALEQAEGQSAPEIVRTLMARGPETGSTTEE